RVAGPPVASLSRRALSRPKKAKAPRRNRHRALLSRAEKKVRRLLALVQGLLQFLARLEASVLAGFDGDGRAGRGVAALAGSTLGDREATEAGKLHAIALLEVLGDGIEDRVERVT